MLTLTNENFNQEVIDYKGRVLIDFWAEWCGPCKMMAPVFESLSKKFSNVKFGKVNVDLEKAIAMEYNIMSIPTLVMFEDGVPVKQLTGANSEQKIAKYFNL